MKEKRLNKAIADNGYCSRRKADELIFAGKVSVNGVPEQNPARRVNESDIIAIDGKKLTGAACLPCYYMLHKPVQTVSTVHDPEGRPTIMDCIPPHLRQIRLYPIGRLDFFSEGLLLLTNDGDFANRLMHPRYHLEKKYEVLVRGSVSDAILNTMRNGMKLSDGPQLLPVAIRKQPLTNGNTLLTMTLNQGINRQIRRMCAQFDMTILRLKRVAQGNLALGNLKTGQIRPLTEQEISDLKKATGLS